LPTPLRFPPLGPGRKPGLTVSFVLCVFALNPEPESNVKTPGRRAAKAERFHGSQEPLPKRGRAELPLSLGRKAARQRRPTGFLAGEWLRKEQGASQGPKVKQDVPLLG
jgi:hypothetical protein